MTSSTTTEKAKKLKHVKIYDRLYELIRNGTYAPGSQLPSEPDLAVQMNVSRMTLRKALALLQEDNLIKNIRGKGNFVNQLEAEGAAEASDGMEKMQHPVYRCCMESLDGVELEFRIEPPTSAITQSLQRVTPAVVIVDRWYKHAGKPCAYTLSFLPIDLAVEEKLDLNDTDALLRFLEKSVYEKAFCCHYACSHTTTGNFTAIHYTLSQHESFLLIQENICAKDRQILVSSKHYIPIDKFKIEINACRDT